jgi:hypothetical protein
MVHLLCDIQTQAPARTAPTGSGLGIPDVYSRAAAADLRRTYDNALRFGQSGA